MSVEPLDDEARRHIEAILMIAEEPVAAGVLAQVLESPVAVVSATLDALAAGYDAAGKGFVLREVAGGWRFYSHPDSSAYVEQFVLASENPRLSKAALETLAIVAYRQPISRAQIAEIRGVNADAVLRTLQVRGLVEPVGSDGGPGQAVLYGTSRTFLERLSLRSLDDLPPLSDYVPPADAAARWDAALSSDDPSREPDIAARIRSKIAEAAAAEGTAGDGSADAGATDVVAGS